MSRQPNILWVVCFGAVLWITGCSGSYAIRPYASPAISSAVVGGVAVLPFDNLTENRSAERSFENMLLVEMLKQSSVHFANPGDVSEALQAERVRLATLVPRDALARLGQRLGVGAVIQGVVQDYSMQRITAAGGSGETPVVSVTVRMLDVRTGDIIWAASAARRGNDGESVFGIGRVGSLELLAQETATQVAEAFAKSVGRAHQVQAN